MNKRFDFSVLPDGFLIEFCEKLRINADDLCRIVKFKCGHRAIAKKNYETGKLDHNRYIRPLINHWYFNDGSMILPDGLVVEVVYADGDSDNNLVVGDHLELFHWFIGFEDDELRSESVIAVKITGAQPDYAKHAKELGMEVIQL